MKGGKFQLPPIADPRKKQSSAGIRLESGKSASNMSIPYNKVMNEYEAEIKRLKSENSDLRNSKDVAEKNYQIVMNDNNALNLKLENLENVFIGNPIQKGETTQQKQLLSEQYMTSNVIIYILIPQLLTENTQLKKQINSLQEKNVELGIQLREKEEGMKTITNKIGDTMSQINDLVKMKQVGLYVTEAKWGLAKTG